MGLRSCEARSRRGWPTSRPTWTSTAMARSRSRSSRRWMTMRRRLSRSSSSRRAWPHDDALASWEIDIAGGPGGASVASSVRCCARAQLCRGTPRERFALCMECERGAVQRSAMWGNGLELDHTRRDVSVKIAAVRTLSVWVRCACGCSETSMCVTMCSGDDPLSMCACFAVSLLLCERNYAADEHA